MSRENMRIIECEGLDIAATVEMASDARHSIYYPANYLIYVEQGTLNLDIDQKIYTAHEGEFLLIRKYSQGEFFKTWKEGQRVFREHIFVLYDQFIREVIRDFPLPEDYMPVTVPVIKLSNEPVLKALMNSIEVYITGQAKIDRQLLRMKTWEALHALTRIKPELIHVFNDFSEPARADLNEFMTHNFTNNLTLEQFARLSGRSLSTFNREFRKIFKRTPQKWIRTQRLELARKLMEQTGQRSSEIYMEVGFEDLAHFSRSFKRHFGFNASELPS